MKMIITVPLDDLEYHQYEFLRTIINDEKFMAVVVIDYQPHLEDDDELTFLRKKLESLDKESKKKKKLLKENKNDK